MLIFILLTPISISANLKPIQLLSKRNTYTHAAVHAKTLCSALVVIYAAFAKCISLFRLIYLS